MSKTKRRWIIAVCCMLVCAVGLVGAYFIYEQVRPSRQSDFPPPKQSQIIGSKRDLSTIELQVEVADLVFQGTVAEVLPPETVMGKPDESDEITGRVPQEVTFYSYRIQVDDVIKGVPDGEIVKLMVAEPLYLEMVTLTEGQEMIFCFSKNDAYHDYDPIASNSGFYYIARDNRVFPADPNSEGMARTSGMDLEQLKAEMRGYVVESAS